MQGRRQRFIIIKFSVDLNTRLIHFSGILKSIYGPLNKHDQSVITICRPWLTWVIFRYKFRVKFKCNSTRKCVNSEWDHQYWSGTGPLIGEYGIDPTAGMLVNGLLFVLYSAHMFSDRLAREKATSYPEAWGKTGEVNHHRSFLVLERSSAEL
jgi:hypothetical protein